MMKNIFKYILIGFAALATALTAEGQPAGYHTAGGVSTAKNVEGPNSDGSYTITLETFATGTSTLITKSTPVDVILVLDISSSMTQYNYTYKDDDGNSVTATRLAALKYAVGKFVDEIARNDAYDDDNVRRTDDDGNETVLGNRIQIITFNSSASVRFTSFQPAYANATTIKTNVNNITQGQGTRTDLGLSTGLTWVNTSNNATYWTDNNLKDDNDHNVVVVMFTDGCPSTTGSTSFTASYAVSAVNNAKSIKDAGATVFSVGMIDWDALKKANANYPTYVLNMMDYISSNFPDGAASTTNTFTCTGTRASSDYYADAEEVDLAEIFKSIAEASGGSTATIGSKTQVRDVVSSSFTIPENTSADDITFYTMDITTDGNSWTNQQTPSGVTAVIGTNASGNSTLTVEGFEYSADENWVGLRYDSGNNSYYAGKKLVIQFKIIANDAATGGVGTNTNTSESGVYVYDEETGEYKCVNYYDVPHTTLPVNIKIKKTGLRHGESATFEIQKIAPKKDEDGNYVYNAIGKPLPDEDSSKEDNGWVTFTKVVVTNKGENGATVEKTVLCLDPNWVYKVIEDDWGWAYTVTGTGSVQTTSTVEENPFTFRNTEKTDVVKHAEAVTINHFATSSSGSASEEHYRSSKEKF